MKKYLLLLLLLCPFSVLANSYTIKTKVGVEGKALEEGEFVFNLIDKDGNIVQTKKNDKDGNIVFDPIEWNTNGITTWTRINTGSKFKFDTVNNMFQIYTIKQADNGIKGYTFDNEITYVKVFNDGKNVSYFKYPSNERIEAEKPHYEWTPFHATNEQLQGTVYVESDLDTHVVRIFRDEAGKYSDNQHIGNKIYSIMSETSEGRNTIYSAIGDDYSDWNEATSYRLSIKKIIIEDPIRPATGQYMFGSFEGLEEITGWENLDTSKMDNMSYMFQGCNSLKKIDLTHFDFSGITSEYGLNYFIGIKDFSSEQHEIKLSVFNIPAGVRTNDIFIFGMGDDYTNVLTNFSFMNNKDLANVISADGIVSPSDSMKFRDFFMNANVKYMDLSGFKLHLFNQDTKRSYYDDGIEQFLNKNKAYYLDISGLTTDYCSYRSNDIRIIIDDLRVLKISDKNSSRNGLVYNPNSNELIYLYNVDNNIMSAELTDLNGYYYLISGGGSNWSECDRYYHGGTWLNIADNSAEYLNKYVKPEVKGVEENPKTGIIKYTIFIIAILALSIYFFNKTRKQTYFNN